MICGGLIYGVYALSVYHNLLYVSGSYNTVNNGAAWNGSTWLNPNNAGYGFGQSTVALSVYNGFLLTGGNGVSTYFDTTFQNIPNIYGCGGCTPCGGTAPDIYVLAVAGYKGNIYAGGSYGNGPGTWGNNAAPYLMEYNGPIGINELKETNAITVFPNPSTGVFTFQFSQSELVEDRSTIDIYNMLGEKVYAAPLNFSKGTSTTISLSDYSAGIYLYRITTKDGNLVSTGKLIKE
jgi:hypothetical protein